MTARSESQDEELDSTALTTRVEPPRHILVVDDEPLIRQLCTRALTDAGFHVDAAEDGAAAWQALNAGNYDLLVTDNCMPKMSGIELLEKLHVARMALPIIVVSGAMPAELVSSHPWLQIDAALVKPFSTAELLATVREVLRMTGGVREQVEPQPNWQDQPSSAGLRLRKSR